MVVPMASVELSVDRSQRGVLGGEWWVALGLATVATIVVMALYGSGRSPVSEPTRALRVSTQADVAGLTSALAKDWGRARAADAAWINACYGGAGDCPGALRRQVTALQRLL